MDLSKGNDPTWAEALEIAQELLNLPDQVQYLIRSGWRKQLSEEEFVKILGFSRLNPLCIISAAQMTKENSQIAAADLAQAIRFLGVQYCALVLAINLVGRITLKTKPPDVWEHLFRETITNIEIGYRLGARVSNLGSEGGAIIGWSVLLGNMLMLAHAPREYSAWEKDAKEQDNPKQQIRLFGCEFYQLGALALQQLGFGTEIAVGAALGTGHFNPANIEPDQTIMRWQAAYSWIEALRQGRDYPGSLQLRNFFPEIAPPKDRKNSNLVLKVLYTEVSKVKNQGSAWTWHLPKADYERTFEHYFL